MKRTAWVCLIVVVGASAGADRVRGNAIGSKADVRANSGTAHAEGAEPRGPLIAAVEFVGAMGAPRDRMMEQIASKPGSRFCHATIQEDVLRLAKSRLCKVASVETESAANGGVNVLFHVEQLGVGVREVVYRHAKHVSVDELALAVSAQSGCD